MLPIYRIQSFVIDIADSIKYKFINSPIYVLIKSLVMFVMHESIDNPPTQNSNVKNDISNFKNMN